MAENAIETQNLSGYDTVEALVNAYEQLKKDYEELAEITKPEFEKSSWQDVVGAFLSEYPEAKEYSAEIGKILIESPQIRDSKNPLERAYMSILSGRKTPDKLAEDEEFLSKFIYNSDKVRDKIISTYLSELNNNLPGTIGGGGETFITPPKSPKNLKEAMNLAERLLNR